jgi:hypothetical protein
VGLGKIILRPKRENQFCLSDLPLEIWINVRIENLNLFSKSIVAKKVKELLESTELVMCIKGN